jgi:hypothetical protein
VLTLPDLGKQQLNEEKKARKKEKSEKPKLTNSLPSNSSPKRETQGR